MELVKYDPETKQYTVLMEQNEFLDLFDMVGGVCATAYSQDFTALGVTKERALELSQQLRDVLHKDNYGPRR